MAPQQHHLQTPCLCFLPFHSLLPPPPPLVHFHQFPPASPVGIVSRQKSLKLFQTKTGDAKTAQVSDKSRMRSDPLVPPHQTPANATKTARDGLMYRHRLVHKFDSHSNRLDNNSKCFFAKFLFSFQLMTRKKGVV